MGQPLEAQIRKLQDFYWSDADPQGRGFVSLADAFRRSGNGQEALRLLREGLGRLPNFASGHVVKGWVLLEEGDAPEAEISFRAALGVDPGNVAALRGLGDLLLERGEISPALEAFREVLRLDPTVEELDGKILDLGERLAASPAGEMAEVPRGGEPQPPRVWDDPEEAAGELDWEGAVLQEDRSVATTELLPRDAEISIAEDDSLLALGFGAGEAAQELWVAEDGVPGPAVEDDALVTRTLGEIYLRQGLLKQAEGVFQELLGRDPENGLLQERLAETRALLGGVAAEAGIESLAPDLIVPIESLAPDLIVPIESLAPDLVVPIASLAPEPEPEAVGIDELAPDVLVPIESLAPDAIVPIESLAPDVIVPIESLAPDVIVPIESLAPDPAPDPGGAPVEEPAPAEPPADPTLDAFQAWLDSLQ